MRDNELREVLEDNIYILKQHINLCNDSEKALPLKVYQKTLTLLNEFKTPKEQVNNLKLLTEIETQETNTPQEQNILTNASALLVASGLLVENQVRYYKNYGFIAKCNEYLNNYGASSFKNVLARVKQYKDNGVKVNNIYGYISKALDKEAQAIKEGKVNA